MNKQFTSKELAQHLNCKPIEAYGFINFMKSQKLIVVSGKRKLTPGKGKPEFLYSLSNENGTVDMIALINKIF